ncbi:MAG: tyrosine-type recombinase/integrase [Eubacteriales bacterium]|nr:tyrosine-type recombinase/integrase [Eubacteriales bacterium]
MIELSIEEFEKELRRDQKSESTIKNYSLAVKEFCNYLGSKNKHEHFTKDDILLYLALLKEKYRCKETINIKLNGINRYLKKINLSDFCVKLLNVKKHTFLHDNEIFTDEEIEIILNEAKKKNKRLYMTLRILFQTGIRISEMEYITYEAIQKGIAEIYNKGKEREVPIPPDLCKILLEYCIENNINSGPIIITRNKKRVHRSYLYREIHNFIISLEIDKKKAHPHTFRHKFAIDYLKAYSEIAIYNLADILGHQKIETTRIYLRKPISEIRESMMYEKLQKKIAS